jgi:hypothetical protein
MQFLKAIAKLGTVYEAGNIMHLPKTRLGVRYVSYPAIDTSGETAKIQAGKAPWTEASSETRVVGAAKRWSINK